jgi:biotin carboxylase
VRTAPPQRHILFINATYAKKVSTLTTARHDLGCRVSVMGPDLPEWATPHVDEYVPADTYELASALEAARRLHARQPIDGVVSFWDRDVEVVATIAADLGLAGCPVEAARWARNKYESRLALERHGVAQPRFARFTDWDGLLAAGEEIGYPLICKPLGASGSKGVFKVTGPGDLGPTWRKITTYLTPAVDKMFLYHPGQYLAEEFLAGHEVSVEGLVCGGVAQVAGITEKWTDETTFQEYQHAFPARYPEPVAETVLLVATAAIRALGLDDCGFHVEVKLTGQGCKIVEVNGRLGGDCIATHLVPVASGIDLVRAALLLAIGDEPKLVQRWSRGACARFLLASRSGKLLWWEGIDRAKEMAGVVELAPEKPAGASVAVPPQKYMDERLCYVVTEGETTGEAVNRAEWALRQVRYELV